MQLIFFELLDTGSLSTSLRLKLNIFSILLLHYISYFLVHCNTSLSIVLSYLHSWHDITNHLSIHQSDSLKWTIISWNSSSSIVNFCNPLTYKFKPTKLSHVCMYTYSSYCLLYSQLKSHYIKFKRFLKQ